MASTGSGKKVVRRIKASDDGATRKATDKQETTVKTETVKKAASVKTKAKTSAKPATTQKTPVTSNKKPAVTSKDVKSKAAKKSSEPEAKSFILFRPFCAIGRYFRDSWRELKQVQWPTRRSAWALTLAVILFSAFIGIFVVVCDWASQWLIQEVIL